jgi:hypothetical protein
MPGAVVESDKRVLKEVVKFGCLALTAHQPALLSCDEDNLMTVFDLGKHEPIAFLPMADGSGCHQVRSGVAAIYEACYGDPIFVSRRGDPNHERKIEDGRVHDAVHTLAVDPEADRVYPRSRRKTVNLSQGWSCMRRKPGGRISLPLY